MQALQVRADIGGMLIAQVAVLLDSLLDDLFQLGRNFGTQLARRSGSAIQNGVTDLRRRLALECLLPRRHFIQYQAEGEQVRPRIQLLTPHLFRRHVGSCLHRHPGIGQVGADCRHGGRVLQGRPL